MNLDLLERLQAASSDEEREWIVLEFTLANLESDMHDAVWAAAIPHWFDASLLAALLAKPLDATLPIYRRLTTLSFIEPFPERGHNVHERTRKLLLDRLWRDDAARFRLFSQRAADFCAEQDQADTGWRIEAIHHLLVGTPDRGVIELQNQGWQWHDSPYFAYDKIEALAHAGREHADSGRLSPGGLGWVQFWEALLDDLHSRPLSARAKFMQIQTDLRTDPYLAADAEFRLGDVHLALAEYPLARQRYEEARPIYHTIGDRRGEANCIRSLGDVHLALAEYPLARGRYAEARLIYHAISDRRGEANCISSLGDVHLALADYPLARQSYEEARPIFHAIGDRRGEAKCIKSLGDVHLQLADYPLARQRYEEALPIYHAIGDRLGEANCIQSLGDVHLHLAEYPLARQSYEEARPIYHAIGDRLGEANCIRNLGDVHLALADYRLAHQRYAEARPIYHAIGARLGEANCIQSLGDVHLHLAEYPFARQSYEEARPIYHAIGDRLGEANCIQSLGDVHLRLAEYSLARQRYEEARPIYHAIGARLGEANCITSLGDMHLRLAEYSLARQHYEEARPIYHAIGVRLGEANCIRSLGDVATEMEEYAEAEENYRIAATRFHQLELADSEANALNALAGAYEAQNRLVQAIDAHTQAIALRPERAMSYRNRASTYITMKDFAAAAVDLARAAELQPDHSYLALRRGSLAFEQGQYAEAASHYRQFIAGLPSVNRGHFGLGCALLGSGDVESGLDEIRQALALTHAPREVREFIEGLKEFSARQPDLSGLAEALALVNAWQPATNAS